MMYSPIVEPTLQLAITAQHRNTSPWGEDRSPPVAPKLKKCHTILHARRQSQPLLKPPPTRELNHHPSADHEAAQ
ncbi:hypothetical protein HBH70_201370 [Parastagonospora nodorum]|nr:hypothetical protein HBI13_235360 [Parastagonospora nodorum]KAH4121153.1 hypothetical protein HBH47_104450 [Parastagonospora nodorum]KAH4390328.1 hypothetical protein HBH94_014420 [Parastagonospora nodorum]KAH4406309.1 hypothetical protein HBH92_166410 [Parastagonospora nodorum]KAH4474059.1 hypothetical protein HBH90_022640 [Parastagonospora nodorum]